MRSPHKQEIPPTQDRRAGGDEKKMETPHVRQKKNGNNTGTQRLPRRIGGDEQKRWNHKKYETKERWN